MSVVNKKLTMTVAALSSGRRGQSSSTCVRLEGTTGTDLNLSNNKEVAS